MAGIAKPSVAGLRQEALYTRLGGSSGNAQNGAGLFDGTNVDGWNANNVFYWEGATAYVEVDIQSQQVNIWRSGVNSYTANKGNLKIKKWNGSTYDDVTSLYPQTLTAIGHTVWEKTISALPKGRYRFEFNGSARIDSEWYIEEMPKSRILVLNNSQYRKYSTTWQTITSTTPTEAEYLSGNTLEEIALIPESAWKELTGTVEFSFYTEDLSKTEVLFNIETEPFSLYDEMGDSMDILYYTDDTAKTSAELELTANYSPLDEIDSDFEVVTWTNGEAEELTDTLTPTLTTDVVEGGTVYGTPVDLSKGLGIKKIE